MEILKNVNVLIIFLKRMKRVMQLSVKKVNVVVCQVNILACLKEVGERHFIAILLIGDLYKQNYAYFFCHLQMQTISV